MQGIVILRGAGVFALAALLSGCHFNTRTSAGRTPLPSNTTLRQASSTGAPQMALSQGPGGKYFAQTSSDTHGVTFSVWLNGSPVNALFPASKSIDITQDMRGHANVVVVQWNRTQKNGSGTLTIRSRQNVVLTAKVTPSSKASGKVSKTFIAKQVPVGQPQP